MTNGYRVGLKILVASFLCVVDLSGIAMAQGNGLVQGMPNTAAYATVSAKDGAFQWEYNGYNTDYDASVGACKQIWARKILPIYGVQGFYDTVGMNRAKVSCLEGHFVIDGVGNTVFARAHVEMIKRGWSGGVIEMMAIPAGTVTPPVVQPTPQPVTGGPAPGSPNSAPFATISSKNGKYRWEFLDYANMNAAYDEASRKMSSENASQDYMTRGTYDTVGLNRVKVTCLQGSFFIDGVGKTVFHRAHAEIKAKGWSGGVIQIQ